MIIEPMKCFTFLLTVTEYLNTHLHPYLIYIGVDTHYKKQREGFRRCFIRDSSIRACRDEGSNAVQTIEAALYREEKKAEICFSHNFTVTAF